MARWDSGSRWDEMSWDDPAEDAGNILSTPDGLAAVPQAALRLYEALPGRYRDHDDAQGSAVAMTDRPLLRLLCGAGGVLDDVERLVDRIQWLHPWEGGQPGGSSSLADPARAEDGWLDWLAQLVGVDLSIAGGTEPAGRRAFIADATTGWSAGARASVATAASTALTGTRHVRVDPHRDAVGPAGAWDLLLTTITSETPDPAAVVAAVGAANAKPAGVRLHHRTHESTWDVIESLQPTWDHWDALTWDELAETGV